MSTTPSRRLHVFATAGISLLLAACGTAASGRATPSQSPAAVDGGTETSAAAGAPSTATSGTAAVRTAGAPAAARVSIVDYAFTGARVTVRTGGRVSWVNTGSDKHSIEWVDAPESPVLQTGGSYGRSFSAPGTYAYVCGIHSSMTGTVVVTAATTPGTPGDPTGTAVPHPTADPTARPAATPDAADRDDDDRDDGPADDVDDGRDDAAGDDHGRDHGHDGRDDEDRDEEHGGHSGPG